MNAVISAGQYKMHKKDINDRLHSLAFKMEKVYNLDKKKGPAAEVYRFFKSTIDDDNVVWNCGNKLKTDKYQSINNEIIPTRKDFEYCDGAMSRKLNTKVSDQSLF